MAVQTNKEKLRKYIRKNIREIMTWMVIFVLIYYILIVMTIPLWMKGLVSIVLIFGGFEAIRQIRGKKSHLDIIKKEIKKAHNNQIDMFSDLNIGMPGGRR